MGALVLVKQTRLATGHFALPAVYGSDNDIVDASGSSLPLIIFGGQGDDTITTGHGRRHRLRRPRPRPLLRARAPCLSCRSTARASATCSASRASRRPSSATAAPATSRTASRASIGLAISVDPTVGGVDTIHVPLDNNVVIGGAAGDVIDLGGGTNLAFGDSGYIEWAQQAGVNEIAQAGSIAPAIGGNDQISTDNGQNVVVGGAGDDHITLGTGTNVVLGDSGAITANAVPRPALRQPAADARHGREPRDGHRRQRLHLDRQRRPDRARRRRDGRHPPRLRHERRLRRQRAARLGRRRTTAR